MKYNKSPLQKIDWKIIIYILNLLHDCPNSRKTFLSERTNMNYGRFMRYLKWLELVGWIKIKTKDKIKTLSLTKTGSDIQKEISGG